MGIKHLFVPHERHKKRSKLLQHPALFGYVLFILALLFSMHLIVSSSTNVLGYATDINTTSLLKYTNQRRADAGLKPLTLNDKLSKAAYAKAQNMFAEDYWAHTSPSGKEPWDFIIASGYDYLYAGENLAVDFAHSKSVVDAWYNSPSHKANLLNSKYTEVGFAVVDGELQGRKTTLVVQMFGYPRRQIAKVTPEDELLNKTKKEELSSEPIKVEKNTAKIAKVDQNKNKQEQAEIKPDENLNNDNVQDKNSNQQSNNVKKPDENTVDDSNGKVLNTANVFNASKYLAVTLGLFLSLLFAIDGYYVRKYNVLRISGHTILHIAFLLLAIIAVWYATIGLIL